MVEALIPEKKERPQSGGRMMQFQETSLRRHDPDQVKGQGNPTLSPISGLPQFLQTVYHTLPGLKTLFFR